MKTAHVEVRAQKSRGSASGRFGGPDTYVAVQIVPDGVEPLACLNHRNATLRGIEIIHCGEGYSDRAKTPRSMLRVALAAANAIADRINAESAGY
jgi:hypothetical protein